MSDTSPPRSGNLALALIGAVIGAALGAVLWGLIAVTTGYSLSLIALLVGALVGGATRLLGRGAGLPYQIIGALFALVGVVAAKYCVIAGILVQKAKEGGVEMGYLDAQVRDLFWPAVQATSEMPDVLYEIAWAFGGAMIAWSILSRSDD